MANYHNSERVGTGDTEQLIILAVIIAALVGIFLYVPNFLGTSLLKLNIWMDGIIDLPAINYENFIIYVNGERDFTFATIEFLNARVTTFALGVPTLILTSWYLFKLFKVIEKDKKNKKILSLEDLIKIQASYFKFMTPVAKTSIPSKHSLDKGIWAKAKKPYDFIEDLFGFKEKNAWDLPEVEKQLIGQLGKKIDCINDIYASPLHIKIILLITILRILSNKDESNKLIDASAIAWDITKNNGIFFHNGKLQKLVKKHLKEKKIVDTINALVKKHAYTNTLLVGAFSDARKVSGKLSTPEIIWLKPTNRTLFYALNQIGRREVWPEAMAVANHYAVEEEHGHALKTPQIVSSITKVKSWSFELQDDLKLENKMFDETWLEINS